MRWTINYFFSLFPAALITVERKVIFSAAALE
jgi:hypothetical protein